MPDAPSERHGTIRPPILPLETQANELEQRVALPKEIETCRRSQLNFYMSVTNILSKDLQSAAIGLAEMVILITAISLGVLLGTLLVSPNKYIPVTAFSSRLDDQKG